MAGTDVPVPRRPFRSSHKSLPPVLGLVGGPAALVTVFASAWVARDQRLPGPPAA